MATSSQKRKTSLGAAHQGCQETEAAKKVCKRRRRESNTPPPEKDNTVCFVDPLPAHIYNLLEKHEILGNAASQELVKRLYNLQEKLELNGRTNFEVASALNIVATFLYHQADFNNAALFFQEELRIEESLMSCEGLSLAVTCNNIGKIYQETCRYQEAIKYYHRALKSSDSTIHSATKENDHAASANRVLAIRLCSTVWYNLGLIHDKLGKKVEAIQAFQLSLKFRKELLGPAHADVACLFFNIAVLQMEQKWLKEATSSMKEFLQVQKSIRANTISDQSLVITLQRLASLHKSNGNSKQSLVTLREILMILRETTELEPAQRTLDMSKTFREIAEIYHERDQLSLAILAAEKSVQLLKTGLLSEIFVSELVPSLILLGSLRQESSEPIRARSIFLEAVRLIDVTSHYASSPFEMQREVSFMLATSNCAPVA